MAIYRSPDYCYQSLAMDLMTRLNTSETNIAEIAIY